MTIKPKKLLFPFFFIFLAAGCKAPDSTRASAAEPETLQAGTKISAVLMKTIESGVSKEGEEVPLIVTEDVKGVGGTVAVKKGTKMLGRIAWSRREGTLDGMLGRPARLHIQLVETLAADGTKVPLSADEKLDPDANYELNRDNTGKSDPSPQLEAVLDDPANEQAVQALAQLLDNGSLSEEAKTPEGRAKLAKLCEDLGLAKTAEIAKADNLSSFQTLLAEAGKPGTLLALTTGQAPLALDAVIETANFVSTVPGRLTRALKGRNIKAYIGTPVVAYVAKDVQVGKQ